MIKTDGGAFPLATTLTTIIARLLVFLPPPLLSHLPRHLRAFVRRQLRDTDTSPQGTVVAQFDSIRAVRVMARAVRLSRLSGAAEMAPEARRESAGKAAAARW